jgi:hypothetical protein
MVPVDVGDEGGTLEGAVARLGRPQKAQARTEIEDDRRFALGFERDASRVAAIPRVLVTGAGAGTSAPEEGEFQLVPPTGEWEVTHN